MWISADRVVHVAAVPGDSRALESLRDLLAAFSTEQLQTLDEELLGIQWSVADQIDEMNYDKGLERAFAGAAIPADVHIAEKTYAIGHVAVSALEFTIREKDGDHPLVITPVAKRRLSHQDLKPEARRELMRELNALWGLVSCPGNKQMSAARHTLELISATRRIHYM